MNLEFTTIKISDPAFLLPVMALQKAAYEIESKIIDCPPVKFPPLIETLELLAASKELFLMAHREGKILGLLAWETLETGVNITRLVVNPADFRTGIGATLIGHFIDNFCRNEIVNVETSTKNFPAIALYQKVGFATESTRKVEPNLVLMRMKRLPNSLTFDDLPATTNLSFLWNGSRFEMSNEV